MLGIIPTWGSGTAAGIAALMATTARARKARMLWACILVKEGLRENGVVELFGWIVGV